MAKAKPKAKSLKKNSKPAPKKASAKPKSAVKAKSKAKPVAKKAAVKAKTKTKVAAKAKVSAKSKSPAAKKSAKASAKKTTMASPKKPAVIPASAKASAMPTKDKAASKVDWSNFVSPLDDRLLVQLTGLQRTTASGLFIPDTVQDVSGNKQGRVVAVGRGHRDVKGRLRPMDVTLGDMVVFPQWSGDKIILQNEELILLRESEVMGVLGSK